MDTPKISRRGFLMGAGAAVAASGLAACSPSLSSTGPTTVGSSEGMPTTWDYEADIVVVGAGGAGHMAACAAHESDASVIMIEKESMVGGDSAICACFASGPWPSRAKEDNDADDSSERFMTDWANSFWCSELGLSGKDEPAERPYCEKENDLFTDAIQWTNDVAGVPWTTYYERSWTPQPSWDTVLPRNFRAEQGIVPFLSALTDSYDDVETIKSTRVYSLVTNEDGRVVGVRGVQSDGKTATFKAKKAVILSTGSFMGDQSMVSQNLGVAGFPRFVCPGATGDGHKMVEEIGGSLKDMTLGEHWKLVDLGSPSANSTITITWLFYGGKQGNVPGIMINFEGKRFVAESLGYHLVAKETSVQRYGLGWYVLDKYGEEILLGALGGDTTAAVVAKADTLDELAERMGVDADTMKAEVDRYNSFVDAGKDDDFNKVMEGCPRIETAPFYALEIQPQPYCTYGGIEVDLDAHVLSRSGDIIPGLYAAGICTGSFAAQEGVFYYGGVRQFLAWGRYAGLTAAADEPWE